MTASSNTLLALTALAAVLGLIWLAQLAARRFGNGRLRGWLPQIAPPGVERLRVVQSLALDPRRRLHLVACDGRHVVLLTGTGQDVVVGWLEPGAAP